MQAGDLIFEFDDLVRQTFASVSVSAPPAPATRDRVRSSRQPSGYCIRTYWAALMASMLNYPLAGSAPMVASQPIIVSQPITCSAHC